MTPDKLRAFIDALANDTPVTFHHRVDDTKIYQQTVVEWIDVKTAMEDETDEERA